MKGEIEMNEWISVRDRLPKVEERVLMYIKYHCYAAVRYRYEIAIGFYEDGKMPNGRSMVNWNVEMGMEYDEELDEYLVPEGWFENTAESFCDDVDTTGITGEVTHWMPLPEPPEEVRK